MRSCIECPKRKNCREICFDLNEELKKVTVGRKERLVEDKDNLEQDAFYRDFTGSFRGDKLKEIIIALHKQKKTVREIAYYHGIGCGKSYVQHVISEYKNLSVHKKNIDNRNQYRKLKKKRDTEKALLREHLFFDGWFDRFR